MPFVATEAAKKVLLPRRGLAGSARALDEAGAKRLLARASKLYTTKKYGGSKTYEQLFAAGIAANKAPSFAAARAEAHALLRAMDADALREASIDALAAAERTVRWADRATSLLGAIAVVRGLEDALRVSLRSGRVDLASAGGYTTAVYPALDLRDEREHGEPRVELRHQICAAPEAEYAKARAAALGMMEGATENERAELAYLFPDEPWGRELLASLDPATVAKRVHGELLTTNVTADVVRAWVGSDGASWLSAWAFDVASLLPEEDAIPLLASGIPELLERPKYGPLLKTPPRNMLGAIACFPTPAAAEAIAPWAGHAILAPIALGFFADHPELGAALEARAGKGKLAETAARALGKGAKAAGPKAKVAPASEVPAVLRDAPWRAKRARSEVVIAGLAPRAVGKERVVVDGALPAAFEDGTPVRDMTQAEVTAWRKRVEKDEYAHVDFEHKSTRGGYEYLRVPKELVLWAWNEHDAFFHEDALRFVATHGPAAIPGFLRRDWVRWLGYHAETDDTDWVRAVTAFVSPRVAPMLAHAATYKRGRRRALAWMARWPDVAAAGLVPAALGAPGDVRRAAEDALAYLAQKGHAKEVRAAAKAHGKAAASAIDALLARDPLAIGAGAPKPPAFLRPERLPDALTKKKHALGADAQRALVEMLQVAPVEPPYPGLAIVRDACDAESLGALALELFEQWMLGDAPGRHEWMLHAIVHFPSDAATRRAASLAREWARKNAAKAERLCGALARLGTDYALMHLAHVAETTRFDALRKATRGMLAEAAAARGLDEDELGDRTVPDVGLDAKGELELSFGARTFTVVLDEHLRPAIKGGGRLPRATKDDDAAAAKQARARWDELDKDLSQIADRQLRRLERAMVAGRAWDAAAFEERVARHPLLSALARRLAWVLLPTKGAYCIFRVAEDGSYADDRDKAMKLPKGARVRLAHPARDALRATGQLFADYAIVQPFEQLGRATFAPTAAEKKARALDRAAGAKGKAVKVLGLLEARGWRRSSAGHVSAFERAANGADGALMVRLPITPGISIESLRHEPEQTTEAAVVLRDGKVVALGALDAVAFSELVRDVEAVRALR